MYKRTFLVAGALLLFLGSAQAQTNRFPDGSCKAHIKRAEIVYSIPDGLLMAVALAESGRGGVPHAWTLNIDGQPYFEPSKESARRRLVAAASRSRNIAIGCMQIFLRFHETDDPAIYLDPAYGVDYAARFLVSLRRQHGSWTRAVARYHAGPQNHTAQWTYVCTVWNHMRFLNKSVSRYGHTFCRR